MRNKYQSGGALLTAILISNLLIVVGVAVANLTVDETRIAKLQEDSSRARAAAEAGIDYLLDVEPTGTVALEDILPGETDIIGTAEFTTETVDNFNTPLLSKDEQYTLYMTGYDPVAKSIIAGTFNDTVSVSKVSPADSSSCADNAFAVELTFINTSNGIVSRSLIDVECDLITDGGGDIDFDTPIDTSGFSSDPHVLIARILAPSTNFEGTKLIFNKVTGPAWPAQGQVIISEAQTAGDVFKKIRLFQSYPQFPEEFFVTTF